MGASLGKKLVYGVSTFAAYAVFGWAFFHYHKLYTEWFGVNILVYTAIAVVAVIYGATRLEWVRERASSAPGKMFAVAAVGFALCLFLGVFFTEPYAAGEIPLEYSYAGTRTGEQVIYLFGDIGGYNSSSGSSSSGDFDLDDGGEALVFLLLVILVIILILGSAFIPHFWVLACAVLVAVMGILAFRELILREYSSYAYD